MYIVEHDYDTSDFYSQENYTYLDFDGIEMDGLQFEDYEIRVEELSVKPDNIDVPLSYTDMEDAAKNNIQEFIEAQNRYDNYGEQIEFTSDEDISFSGENVCSVLDLFDYDDDIRNISDAILLYRDIEENDNEFVYTSYIASGPGRGDDEGAVIYRNVYHVDKASHKLNIDKDCIKDIFY